VLIVTRGRLADTLGRRRIFFVGSAVFVALSLLAAAAPSAVWLIVCRALMGIGGAMMWPAVLGMTYALLPEDRAALAGGLIIGAAGFGNAAGPLIGGALTAIDWRLILVLNLPVAAFACLVTWRAVSESRF
jgi:MFS family permease